MGSLRYRGRPVEANPDLSYRGYVDAKKSADLTSDQVDALINSGLTAYADKTYVDAQDAKNATKSYIDGQDNLRLKLANIGIANGIAGLDSTGKIPREFINAPLTQHYARGPWTPSAYNTGYTDLTTETTLYSVTVTDPGYPYRLFVFGEVDLRSSTDSAYGIVNVRAGTPTGEIVSQGFGASSADDTVAPLFGDDFNLPNGSSPASSGWSVTPLDGGGGGYAHNGTGGLVWFDSGAQPHSIRYRRTLSADALTMTDYQKIGTHIGIVGESPFNGGAQFVSLLGRMSSDESSYVSGSFDRSVCNISYVVDGVAKQMLNGVDGFIVSPANNTAVNTSAGVYMELVCGMAEGVRKFAIVRSGAVVMTAIDTEGHTALGSSNRGWGFVGHAGDRAGLGQTTPPGLSYMLVSDVPPNYKMVSVIPMNLTSATVRTGNTDLFVRAVSSGGSNVRVSPVKPNILPITVPAG